ncbi:MAG: VCBS repeat-containing protein, partial [Verrucomicrobiae bacterium]|nr:VCBS repeat-containing protein [Verrucomicrobiae bacterium]
MGAPMNRLRGRTFTTPAPWLVAAVLLAGCDPSPQSRAPAETAAPSPSPGPQAPAPAEPLFTDVTQPAGINFQHQLADGDLSNIMESDGAGGVVFDCDGDGLLDLYLVNSGPAPVLSDAPPETVRRPNRLYRNHGDGSFEDRTEIAGVAGHGFGTTAAAADYDNDGDTDLLVVNFGGVILFQNNGDGTFKDVTAPAGLTHDRAGISATFLDADRDGWLDLFVANYLVFDPAIKPAQGSKAPYPGPLAYDPEFNVLYRNRGDGTFEDVSETSGIRVPGHRAMSVTAFDYDLDGDADLYVSNDGTANLLLQNDGQGHFKDVALETGVGFNGFGKADGSMGACIGDVDGDTRPDLLVTRFGNASLYLNSD